VIKVQLSLRHYLKDDFFYLNLRQSPVHDLYEFSSSDKKSSEKIDNNFNDEWKRSRDTIDRYAGVLTDLRKYGFTLITGILTAGSFLGFSSTAALAQVAVIIVTMILVVVLYWLDTSYQSLLFGAVFRARYLGIFKLNWGLSIYISTFYAASRISWVVVVLYVGFLIGALILGIFVAYTTVTISIPKTITSQLGGIPKTITSQLGGIPKSTTSLHSHSNAIPKQNSTVTSYLSHINSTVTSYFSHLNSTVTSYFSHLNSTVGASIFSNPSTILSSIFFQVLIVGFGLSLSVLVAIRIYSTGHRIKFVHKVDKMFDGYREDMIKKKMTVIDFNTEGLDEDLRKLFREVDWPHTY
jgi:hypothetical protein